MILWHVDKRREALAEPHRNVPVHVDSKRLKALLEATHGIKLEGAGIHPEIHAADLRQSQRADGHKACTRVKRAASAPRTIPGSSEQVRPWLSSQLWVQEERGDTILWHTDAAGGHMESKAAIGVWGRELTLVQHDLGEK